MKLSLIEAKVNESEEARRDETRRAWRVRVGMGRKPPGRVWCGRGCVRERVRCKEPVRVGGPFPPRAPV